MYNASAAISSGVPILPIGCLAMKAARTSSGSPTCAFIRSWREGDSTVPGQMALHRIPRFI